MITIAERPPRRRIAMLVGRLFEGVLHVLVIGPNAHSNHTEDDVFVSFSPREFDAVLVAVAEIDDDRIEVYGNAIGGRPEEVMAVAKRLKERGGHWPARAAARIRRNVERLKKEDAPARI